MSHIICSESNALKFHVGYHFILFVRWKGLSVKLWVAAGHHFDKCQKWNRILWLTTRRIANTCLASCDTRQCHHHEQDLCKLGTSSSWRTTSSGIHGERHVHKEGFQSVHTIHPSRCYNCLQVEEVSSLTYVWETFVSRPYSSGLLPLELSRW